METLKLIFSTIGTMLTCYTPFIIIFIHDISTGKDKDVEELWMYKYALISTLVFSFYVWRKLFSL